MRWWGLRLKLCYREHPRQTEQNQAKLARHATVTPIFEAKIPVDRAQPAVTPFFRLDQRLDLRQWPTQDFGI